MDIVTLSKMNDYEFIRAIKNMEEEEVLALIMLKDKLKNIEADLENYYLDK